MTVGELKEKLKDIPDYLEVLVEGEDIDNVSVEKCGAFEYVRIFKNWNMDITLGSAGLHD